MEAIIIIILLIVGWSIFSAVLSAGAKTVKSAGKAALGKGSFAENMELEFKGMGPFEVRLVDGHLNDDGTGPIVKHVEGRGLFPIYQTTNIGFMISVIDTTDEENEPVLSFIESFQELHSIAYQHRVTLGQVEPNLGFAGWAKIGVVIPEIIQPPRSGTRKLMVVVRMVDLDNLPFINLGFHGEDRSGIISMYPIVFSYTYNDNGYQDASENRDEAIGLSLKIGMAVAMSDGSLDDSEGKVLQSWTTKAIKTFSDQKREKLKNIYNSAMREAYDDARAGNLVLSALTDRLNEIGERSIKYEALELCFEVMAADGIADQEELNLIRKVAGALGLDMEEVEKMRDQRIIGLNSNVSDHASIEVLLGIEPDWTHDQIKKHLRTEFQKWNNRLNTLPEGEERNNAQYMLDKISEARKKYA